jgi:hypothetical protein
MWRNKLAPQTYSTVLNTATPNPGKLPLVHSVSHTHRICGTCTFQAISKRHRAHSTVSITSDVYGPIGEGDLTAIERSGTS